ncbi:hypothetical protein D3C76_842560 [compost metagenome]
MALPACSRATGRLRRSLGNHLYSAWVATGDAGPSPMPNNTRQATMAHSEVANSIGSWISAQNRPMPNSKVRVGRRLAMKPPTTAEIAKNQCKAPPIKPNSVAVRPSSALIGTATRPITTLSRKLTSISRASSAATSQAVRGLGREESAVMASTLVIVVGVAKRPPQGRPDGHAGISTPLAMVLRWISLVPVRIRIIRVARKTHSTGWPCISPAPPCTCTALSAMRKAASETNSLHIGAWVRISPPASLTWAVA